MEIGMDISLPIRQRNHSRLSVIKMKLIFNIRTCELLDNGYI